MSNEQSSKTQDYDLNGERGRQRSELENGVRISIATKMVLSFLFVIVVTGAIFTGVSILLISNHIEADSREQALSDLEDARDLYLDRLDHLNNVVASTAGNIRVKNAITSGNIERVTDELLGIKYRESLDLLTVTDADGTVLLRTSDLGSFGDNISHEELIETVLHSRSSVASTTTISREDLRKESRLLADRALQSFSGDLNSILGGDLDEVEFLVSGAAAPVFDYQGLVVGVIQGGNLVNSNANLVCEINRSLFGDDEYNGKDVGFVTIYQDEVGVLTCPINGDNLDIVGTVVSDEVYNQVVVEGEPWVGRDYIRDSWYVTVYEPITNSDNEVVGILQIGKLEQVYLDIRNQIIIAFLAVTLVGALIAMVFAYFIANRISGPIKKLVAASKNVAHGEFEARIETSSMSNDELAEMAIAFNAMASALEERDEELRELTATRIGRAERLAMIGRLSANVAHELNNPLQGIVTYSHLLIERMPEDYPNKDYVKKIVVQADRCRDIIRGLLDFARQREPVKTLCDINIVLQDTISLLENQASFHNIDVLKEFDAELPRAVIDPSQLERVFINMIINAAEAMDGSGQLALTTRPGPIEGTIEVVITDTGHGIPNENIRRIFDPFFTTKEVGRGTGLGLAISYGIVKEHGGTISVRSKVGLGTTFIVTLPVRVGIVVAEQMVHPDIGKELTLLSGL
jgi:two-component system NtrC family sensor kinase